MSRCVECVCVCVCACKTDKLVLPPAQIRETILRYFTQKPSYLVDPHTAVGVQAANWIAAEEGAEHKQVILSTAHPAKFSEAVLSSLSSSGVAFDFERDVLPKEMHGLLEKERRVEDVKVADGLEAGGPSPSDDKSRLAALVRATGKVLDREAEKRGHTHVVAGKGTESV